MALPDRRSIRLKGYDYSSIGLYFVTICTDEKRCKFGAVADARVNLSPLGAIVRECWVQIPYHFARVDLDAFVIMPNHIHGILILHRDWTRSAEWAQRAAPLPSVARAAKAHPRLAPKSLAAIIRSFKSAVTRLAGERSISRARPIWQRNYYEHIVRNGEDLQEIRRYIAENPRKWEMDKENPEFQR